MMIHKVKMADGTMETLAGEFLILKDGCLLNYDGEKMDTLSRIIAAGQWTDVSSQLIAPLQGGKDGSTKLN